MTLKNVYPIKLRKNKLYVEAYEQIAPWWKFDNRFQYDCLVRLIRDAVFKRKSFIHEGYSVALEPNEYVFSKSATSWTLNKNYKALVEKGHLKVRRLLGRTIFELAFWDQITSDYPRGRSNKTPRAREM